MLRQEITSHPQWNTAFSTNIDRWLADRQRLLVEYCDLSRTSNSDDPALICAEKLRHLCQTLIDYVSAGHFGIYDQLMHEGQINQAKEALIEASRHFSLVDKTTDDVLDFNDKYLETDDLTVLIEDLSRLGEILEARFSAEDSMISVLHRQSANPRTLN